jgi:undecaprenyl-diphosphatase
MDWRLAHALNGFAAQHDLFEDPVTQYVRLSEVFFAGLVVLLFLLVRRNRDLGARAAVSALVASGLALLVAQFVSAAVDRPRPFVAHPDAIHVYVARSADPSFPSDHATAAFAIAVAILLRSRRWGIPAVLMAAALAVGRVAVGVHYPADVLAGAGLGSLSAIFLYAVAPLRRWLDGIAESLAAGRDVAYRRLGLSA